MEKITTGADGGHKKEKKGKKEGKCEEFCDKKRIL